MELPHLGEQCEVDSCGQLDFLPIKCYGCHKKFCTDHFQYENHNCPVRHTKDVQVPVCPLCDSPVPTAKGVSPDTTVSAHIDRDCKSDPAVAKRNKVYTNKCSVKKCKQKEMMKVQCDQCKQSYCLKHRHAQVRCKEIPMKACKYENNGLIIVRVYPKSKVECTISLLICRTTNVRMLL